MLKIVNDGYQELDSNPKMLLRKVELQNIFLNMHKAHHGLESMKESKCKSDSTA